MLQDINMLASLLKLQLNQWVIKSTTRAKNSVNQTLLWGYLEQIGTEKMFKISAALSRASSVVLQTLLTFLFIV